MIVSAYIPFRNLGNNKLIGTIPKNINNSTALKDLVLSQNSLNGSLPDMGKLTKLSHV